MGVRDPGRYLKFLCGCKRLGERSQISVWVQETRGGIPNFYVGVRDPRRYPEFLCGCKRPGECFVDQMICIQIYDVITKSLLSNPQQ